MEKESRRKTQKRKSMPKLSKRHENEKKQKSENVHQHPIRACGRLPPCPKAEAPSVLYILPTTLIRARASMQERLVDTKPWTTSSPDVSQPLQSLYLRPLRNHRA